MYFLQYNIKYKSCVLYSQSLLYRHLLNSDTLLLWTVCFVLGERNPYILSIFSPLNMDTC